MNEIIQSSVYKTQKGTPVTDSVKVAQVFGKMHKNIMKSIRNIMGSAQNLANEHWFAETTYTDAQGKRQPMFLMNRDGFSLLTMSLTGEKGDVVQGGIHQRIQQDGGNDKGTCASIPGDSSNVRTGFAACGGTGGNNRKPTKAD